MTRPADPLQPSKKRNARNSAPELAPPAAPTAPAGKLGILVDCLRTPGGVDLNTLSIVTGWQPHSVRGAIAGALKKRGYQIHSAKDGKAPRLYSLIEAAQ